MYRDDATHLNPGQSRSLCRVLSALMTGEGSEALVFEPMLASLNGSSSGSKRLAAYMEQHSQDEQRHADSLQTYLKETFSYQKSRKTVTDVLLYDALVPRAAAWIRREPRLGTAVLMAYEIYTSYVYNALHGRAQALRLPTLASLAAGIMEDEKRHLAGVLWLGRHFPALSLRGRLRLKFLLRVFRWDVGIGRASLHNRSLRRGFIGVGIDEGGFSAMVRRSASEAWRFGTSGQGANPSRNALADDEGLSHV